MSDGNSYDKLATYPISETNLSTSFETYELGDVSEYSDDKFMQVLSGWFTAPTTGKYRFFVSCDDICRLLLDSATPYDPLNLVTPAPEVIAYRT